MGGANGQSGCEFHKSELCELSTLPGGWINGLVERVLEWSCIHCYWDEGEEEKGEDKDFLRNIGRYEVPKGGNFSKVE